MSLQAVLSGAMALARPALARLDPERAHDLTIALLEKLPPLPAPDDDPALAVPAFGLVFPNPLGMAAGFDKGARVPDALLALGFGFAEIGTVTPRPQPGNPRPRLFRLPEDEAVVNRFGFNSEGHGAVHARLLARRGGRPGIVGVNIGANKDAADRGDDYSSGITAFADVASYFTVNVSSPNTPGLRDLQHEAALDDLLARVMAARDAAPVRRPVLLKIAPDVSEAELDGVVATLRRRRLDGLIVSNTTVMRPAALRSPHAAETGGLSGRPLFVLSTRVLAQAFLRLDGFCPLVGVGGVDSPGAALAKIEAGASLLQLYTALVYKGPGLVADIKAGLLAAVRREGVPLSRMVGRRASEHARAAVG